MCTLLSCISIAMVCFVLVLSTTHTMQKANLGPKFFVISVMLVDLVLSVANAYTFVQFAVPDNVREWWSSFMGVEGTSIGTVQKIRDHHRGRGIVCT